MDTLARLERATAPSHDDLLAGSRAYWSATPARRADFAAARLGTVERLAGAYTANCREIRTSGSSSGVARGYRWGPAFDAHHRRDHDQRFVGIDYDTMTLVRVGEYRPGRPKPPPSIDLDATEVNGWGRLRVARLPDPARDAAAFLDMLGRDTAKTPLLWIHPQQALASLRRGDGLFETLGESVACCATGEACPAELRAALAPLGVDLRDAMKVWNGGCGFFTCDRGGLHWDDFAATTSAEGGRLAATDLWNLAQRFVDHRTGDEVAITQLGECPCGRPAQANEWAAKTLSLDRPGGRPLIYHDLLGLFLSVAGLREEDVVGVCFAVGETRMVAFHELLDEGRAVEQGAMAAFADAAGLGLAASASRGIPYGPWKPRRLFRCPDAELEGLEAGYA